MAAASESEITSAIPPPQAIRERIAQIMQELKILRRLLRIADETHRRHQAA